MSIVESVRHPTSISDAVNTLQQGRTVLVPGPAVWGWVADARCEKATAEIIAHKGESRKQKPFAILTTADQAVQWFDYKRINPQLAEIVSEPKELVKRVGGISFLRIPVTSEANLPPSVLSKDAAGLVAQVFVVDGSPWLEAQARLAEENGVLQAITSFNVGGKPERVNLYTGIIHGWLAGVGKILVDTHALCPQSEFWGSYFIMEAGQNGLVAKRDGNVAREIHQDVWQQDITGQAESRHFKGGQLERIALTQNLHGPGLRQEVLSALVSGTINS